MTEHFLMMTQDEAARFLGVGADELLTREEAATLLRVTPRTLINWEAEGRAPRAARIGPRTCVYSKRDLLAHVEACRAAAPQAPARAGKPPAMSAAVKAAVEAERRRAAT